MRARGADADRSTVPRAGCGIPGVPTPRDQMRGGGAAPWPGDAPPSRPGSGSGRQEAVELRHVQVRHAWADGDGGWHT